MPEKPSQKTQNSFERALRPQSRIFGNFLNQGGQAQASYRKPRFTGSGRHPSAKRLTLQHEFPLV